MVGQSQRLVVEIAVQVCLAAEEGNDRLRCLGGVPPGPEVAGEQRVRTVAVPLDGLVEILRPGLGVPDLGAAQAVEVVQGWGGVLGHAQRPHVGQVEVHLRRSLGARGELELQIHRTEGDHMAGPGDAGGDRERRGQQARQAGGIALAQPGVDLPLGGPLQQRPIHEQRPALHRVAGVDVLAHRVLQEPLRSDDVHPLRQHAAVEQTQHTAVVVEVGVGKQHRADGAVLTAVFTVEGKGGRRALLADQGVHHHDLPGDTGGVLQEADVRQIHPAHLVDGILDNLEQAGVHVQQRITPQTGVDGVGRLPGQERIRAKAPRRDVAADPVHREIRRQSRDQPPFCKGCLGVLIQWRDGHPGVEILRQRRRWLGRAVRGTGQRFLLLSRKGLPGTDWAPVPVRPSLAGRDGPRQ